jgi:putative ABC transport system permease protein
MSIFVALVAATGVGVVFGTVPATRAAQLDPVEALKYE